jgi:hypothetical protein
MKYCAICNIKKPYEEFNKSNRKYGDGYGSYCRSCASHYYFNKKRTEVIRHHIQRDSKICINCNKKKDITEFGKKISSQDGRNDYCKICWSMNIRDGLD